MSKPESHIKDWIVAARLRTLPLALSSIITGSGIAIFHSVRSFSLLIFLFTIVTTVLLQVLSNWANDYGDYNRGTDNETRIGPERSLQSGAISADSMRKAIVIMALCALSSGLTLLYVSGILWSTAGLVFLSLGLLAIWAAIKYTAGKNPYGYAGFGDMSVFFFFGMLGVLGSAYLQGSYLPNIIDVFPAAAIGFLSASVLNLNNMRDAEDDASKNKKTMAVRLGNRTSKIYHACLVTLGIICFMMYKIKLYESPIDFLFVLVIPLLIVHLVRVMKNKEARELDPELKKVAIGTFLMSILFFISQVA